MPAITLVIATRLLNPPAPFVFESLSWMVALAGLMTTFGAVMTHWGSDPNDMTDDDPAIQKKAGILSRRQWNTLAAICWVTVVALQIAARA